MTTEQGQRSFANRGRIEKSAFCACYCCLERFPVSDVTDWLKENGGGETACCPRCGIDSVVADEGESLPSDETLQRWHRESFKT